MSVNPRFKAIKGLSWAGRIVIFIGIIGFFVQGIDWSIHPFLSFAMIVFVGLEIVGVAGCILVWWNELPAGIMFVICSIGLSVWIIHYAWDIVAWVLFCLPYLFGGVLILTSRLFLKITRATSKNGSI